MLKGAKWNDNVYRHSQSETHDEIGDALPLHAKHAKIVAEWYIAGDRRQMRSKYLYRSVLRSDVSTVRHANDSTL
jgi:hypothetical protein